MKVVRCYRASEARPNAAHEVIAKMSSPMYLKNVAPNAKTFHLVTQNVDRLSVLALQQVEEKLNQERAHTDGSGRTSRRIVSPNSIIEMHGRIYDVKCTQCDHCQEDRSMPLCTALGAADAEFSDYNDAGSKQIDIPIADLPHCSACGALARPGVVWFGEKPYHLDEINSVVYKADLCLVIGTSSTVRLCHALASPLLIVGCEGPTCIDVCVPRAETWREGCRVQYRSEREGRGR